VSLSCFVVAMLVSIGGFEGAGHSNGVAAAWAYSRARVDRLPREITGVSALSREDGLAEPLFAHAAVARRQTTIEAEAASERRAAAQLRSSALTLSVATPPLAAGQRVTATISFYYCQDAPGVPPYGDGGGFCGAMANGAVVFPGAAACARQYLGQRFRIVGDPTDRIYTCADTGSAVFGLHRDIWFNASVDGRKWQHVVGQRGTIEILP
jgi:hypothetical protein